MRDYEFRNLFCWKRYCCCLFVFVQMDLMVIYMSSSFGIFLNINSRLFCLFAAENSLMVVLLACCQTFMLFLTLFFAIITHQITSQNHRSQIFKKFNMIKSAEDIYKLCIFTNIFPKYTIQFSHLISNNL